MTRRYTSTIRSNHFSFWSWWDLRTICWL